MNSFFKTLIAGHGAKKLGGGCFSTILVFVVIYWALGQCNRDTRAQTRPHPVKNERHVTVAHVGNLNVMVKPRSSHQR